MSRRRTPPDNPRSGILLIDKPGGLTSHDVVSRARKSVGTRKIGHAGTLDPMATGLLVLGVNNSTRLLTWMSGLDKTYSATIRLGAGSSTDDAEGELGESATRDALDAVSAGHIRSGVDQLIGDIRQRPSSVSAIKVDGRRAYARVRDGENVALAERAVTVSSFAILHTRRVEDDDGHWIDIDAVVECSSGTYIRALARDLGTILGVGGHVTALRRTRIGPFDIRSASLLDAPLASLLVAPEAAAALLFPTVELDADQSRDLAHGKRIRLDAPPETVLAALGPDGRLLGIAQVENGRARILANFPPDAVRDAPAARDAGPSGAADSVTE